MPRILVISIAVALVATAACTSTHKGNPSSPGASGALPTIGTGLTQPPTVSAPVSANPPPSTSISATSTATPWTKQKAAAEYISMTTPATNALANLAAATTTATLPQAKALMSALAKADDNLVNDLAAGQWPTTDVGLVNTFIAATVAARDTFDSLSKKTTVEAMRAGEGPVQSLVSRQESASADLAQALGTTVH